MARRSRTAAREDEEGGESTEQLQARTRNIFGAERASRPSRDASVTPSHLSEGRAEGLVRAADNRPRYVRLRRSASTRTTTSASHSSDQSLVYYGTEHRFLLFCFSFDARVLQANWEVRLSSSRGVAYYYNMDTKESVWDPPADLTPEQIKALPGAHYLNRPSQVRASHLLIKHKDSRRPSSWKEVRLRIPFVLSPLPQGLLFCSRLSRARRRRLSKY